MGQNWRTHSCILVNFYSIKPSIVGGNWSFSATPICPKYHHFKQSPTIIGNFNSLSKIHPQIPLILICPMLVWRFDHHRSKVLIPDLLSVLIVFAQEVPQHGLVALGIGQQVGVHVAHATDHGLESRPGDRKKPMDHGWPWHMWEFQGGFLGLNQLKRSYTSIFLQGY